MIVPVFKVISDSFGFSQRRWIKLGDLKKEKAFMPTQIVIMDAMCKTIRYLRIH